MRVHKRAVLAWLSRREETFNNARGCVYVRAPTQPNRPPIFLSLSPFLTVDGELLLIVLGLQNRTVRRYTISKHFFFPPL